MGAALGASSAWKPPHPAAAPGPTSSPGTDFRVPTPVQGRQRIQQGGHTEGGHGRTRGCLLQPWRSRQPYPAPVSVVDETSDVRQVSSYRLSQLSPPRRRDGGRYPLWGSDFQPSMCIRPPGERWGNRVLLGVSNSGGLDGPEPAFLTGSRARRKPHSEDHCLDRVVKVQGADTVNGRRSWPVTQSLQRTVAATSTGATEAKSAGHPGAAE